MAEWDIKAFLKGSNDFARRLYSSAAATDNTFVSPFGVHSILTLISQDPWFYRKTVFKYLLYIQDVNRAVEHYQHMSALFSNVNNVDLLLTNKALFKSNYELEELLKSRLTNNFMYDISPTDFNIKEHTVELINDYTKNKTANKISNIVIPNSLGDETCLALLNTLYFSGKWAEPFNEANTVPAVFYLNDDETTVVQMMRKKSEFYYKDDTASGLKILQLPYVNDDVSLIVVLPKDKIEWDKFKFFYDLATLTEDMSKQEVYVCLPKFKIEGVVELKSSLCQMGFQDVFNADLVNIINGEEINLHNIHQKVFIDVNENGSEVTSGTISLLGKAEEGKCTPKAGVVIYEMNVKSEVSNRFAKTNVVWRTKNVEAVAKEAIFKVVLTETAFITEFVMEIGGKSYKSHIKQKEEAKMIYSEALARGRGAGLVEAKTRDSKEFSVSVNLEPESVAVFSLTYEEMLQRIQDQYELVLNICPGQIVDDLRVEVHIAESRPLKFVKTPVVRSGKNISTTEVEKYLEPSSIINIINSKTASIKFNPDSRKQRTLAHYLGDSDSDGFSGQFIVQYDVERDPQDGQVLLQDGYFVHFFAPNDLDPLPKHVVFALDTSGSMGGEKIVQLREAMMSILSEIRTNDIINIIEFNDEVIVWDINSGTKATLPVLHQEGEFEDSFNALRTIFMPDATIANEETIKKAKKVVEQLTASGCTYIIGALEAALYVVKQAQDKVAGKREKYQPIIVFLTDGQPNVGISTPDGIVQIVTKLNHQHNKVPIFSLSFGHGADKHFLRKLSLKNKGFSRHIYEAADASLQLQEFYKQISSPLLTDINFKYDAAVEEITRTYFPIFFRGSELIVTGRYRALHDPPFVECWGSRGPIIIQSSMEAPVASLERLWAYMTVKQLLDERDSVDDKTEITRKAVDLALKYSFVTDVTSLVVVKPDERDTLLQAYSPFSCSVPQNPASFCPFTAAAGLMKLSEVYDQAEYCSADISSDISQPYFCASIRRIEKRAKVPAPMDTEVRFHRQCLSSKRVKLTSGGYPDITQGRIHPMELRSYLPSETLGALQMDDNQAPVSTIMDDSNGFPELQDDQLFEASETLQVDVDERERQTKKFIANRPFLVFLQFKKENKVVILLNGGVNKPTTSV